MIAFIKGTLQDSWDCCCLVLTATGVGYEMMLPSHTWNDLPAKGAEVSFYISMVTREDACELYGFATLDEKRTFEILKGISRIGPKTALALLAAFRPNDLQAIAMEGNLDALAGVSGIGRKTAQHLLLELKYKLKVSPAGNARHGASASALPGHADAVAVLVNLGYDEMECSRIVREIASSEPDLDDGEIVRAALKLLAKEKS